MSRHVIVPTLATMSQESLLRSARMALVQLYIPADGAHAAVTELGELGSVQFRDLNPDVPPFQRAFVADMRRLDEMDRRVAFLARALEREALPVRPLESALPLLDARRPMLLTELATRLREHEERIAQMNTSFDALQQRLQHLEEARAVMHETAAFFAHAGSTQPATRHSVDDDAAPLLTESGVRSGADAPPAVDLAFVAGTIDRERMATLERVLWRALRGNLYMNYAEIEHPLGPVDAPVHKNVFVVFAHGAAVLAKIRRICESMGGTLFAVDGDAAQRDARLAEVAERIEDHENILYSTGAARRAELVRIAESLAAWADVVRREKLVFATLSMCQSDGTQHTLIAEGWVPVLELAQVQLALRRAQESTAGRVASVLQVLHTRETPPTKQWTTRFSEGFQAIIDAYGTATYGEINPGLFTIITFPFLFAVMFGDLGHGMLMLLASGALVVWEKRLLRMRLDEISSMFFYGRYIILLMSAFSMFTGLLYNDIFSRSMHLFRSGWTWPRADGAITAEPNGHVYAIGLDPAWHGASNSLMFSNSLKMKLSIVLGVVHMTFAMCLNVPNHLHFGHASFIWAELLPQMLFMQSLFGYLVVTIIYKWSVDWYATDAAGHPLHNSPPGLLNMLIYMFLSPGNVAPESRLFAGQAQLQTLLLLVAVVCVPWMLLAKPYILYRENQAKATQGYLPVDRDDVMADADAIDGGGAEHEEFSLGEVFIHQVIHTIEFCLGCISNTASYLRLWALSLAHAQLSQVLWDMTIKNVFGMTGIAGVLATTFAFALWFALTLAILCVMEGLSAFLHALRLHWVEGGSKHYEAAGYPFEPLELRAP